MPHRSNPESNGPRKGLSSPNPMEALYPKRFTVADQFPPAPYNGNSL